MVCEVESHMTGSGFQLLLPYLQHCYSKPRPLCKEVLRWSHGPIQQWVHGLTSAGRVALPRAYSLHISVLWKCVPGKIRPHCKTQMENPSNYQTNRGNSFEKTSCGNFLQNSVLEQVYYARMVVSPCGTYWTTSRILKIRMSGCSNINWTRLSRCEDKNVDVNKA